ncbi:YncE family protein [Planctomycetaceae bacterium SH139]
MKSYSKNCTLLVSVVLLSIQTDCMAQLPEIVADRERQLAGDVQDHVYSVIDENRVALWHKNFRDPNPRFSQQNLWSEVFDFRTDTKTRTDFVQVPTNDAEVGLVSRHHQYRLLFIKFDRNYEGVLYQGPNAVRRLPFQGKDQRIRFSESEKWLIHHESRPGNPRKYEPRLLHDIAVFETASGKLERKLKLSAEVEKVRRIVDVSSDGRTCYLEAEIQDKRSKVIVAVDMTTGTLLWQYELEHRYGSTNKVQFNLATNTIHIVFDKAVEQIDASSGERKGRIEPGYYAADVDVSPDGRWIAIVGNSSEFVMIYSAEIEKPVALLKGKEKVESSFSESRLSWGPDSETLISMRKRSLSSGRYRALFRWRLTAEVKRAMTKGVPENNSTALLPSVSVVGNDTANSMYSPEWANGVGFGKRVLIPNGEQLEIESEDTRTITAFENEDSRSYRVVLTSKNGFLDYETSTNRFRQLLRSKASRGKAFRGLLNKDEGSEAIGTAIFPFGDDETTPALMNLGSTQFSVHAIVAYPHSAGYQGFAFDLKMNQMVRFVADREMKWKAAYPVQSTDARSSVFDIRGGFGNLDSAKFFGHDINPDYGSRWFFPYGVVAEDSETFFVPLPKGPVKRRPGQIRSLLSRARRDIEAVRMTEQGKLVFVGKNSFGTADQNLNFKWQDFDEGLYFRDGYDAFSMLGDGRHAVVVLNRRDRSGIELVVLDFVEPAIVSRTKLPETVSGESLCAANGTIVVRDSDDRHSTFFAWQFREGRIEWLGATDPSQFLVEAAETWGLSDDGQLLLTLSKVTNAKPKQYALGILPIATIKDSFEYPTNENPRRANGFADMQRSELAFSDIPADAADLVVGILPKAKYWFAISPDDRWLVGRSDDSRMIFHDIVNGSSFDFYVRSAGQNVGFNPTGTKVVFNWGHEFQVWDLSSQPRLICEVSKEDQWSKELLRLIDDACVFWSGDDVLAVEEGGSALFRVQQNRLELLSTSEAGGFNPSLSGNRLLLRKGRIDRPEVWEYRREGSEWIGVSKRSVSALPKWPKRIWQDAASGRFWVQGNAIVASWDGKELGRTSVPSYNRVSHSENRNWIVQGRFPSSEENRIKVLNGNLETVWEGVCPEGESSAQYGTLLITNDGRHVLLSAGDSENTYVLRIPRSRE